MKSRCGFVALVLLGGCVGTAPRNPSTAPEPDAPVQTSPPRRPDWKSVAGPGQIVAEGSDTVPESAPDRLATDLADGAACASVASALAERASRTLPRLKDPPSAAAVARVRSGLERAQHPGCRILERSTTRVAGRRRARWSLAVLDSSESLIALRRELSRIDSSRADAWSRGVLDLP